MRTIKFRAWARGRMYKATEINFAKNSFTDGEDETHILYSGCNPTFMQFTGLTDKSGKEIYEGDIVQYDFLPEGGDQRAEVIYEGRSFSLKNGGNSYMPFSERMEIIGNIYENPELIGKK
jgi:uncharacterized phage protein (TIGR01671 family)